MTVPVQHQDCHRILRLEKPIAEHALNRYK